MSINFPTGTLAPLSDCHTSAWPSWLAKFRFDLPRPRAQRARIGQSHSAITPVPFPGCGVETRWLAAGHDGSVKGPEPDSSRSPSGSDSGQPCELRLLRIRERGSAPRSIFPRSERTHDRTRLAPGRDAPE